VIFANFSEHQQAISARILDQYAVKRSHILHGVSQTAEQGDLIIEPLDFMVFGN
jgi:hypothetical protein